MKLRNIQFVFDTTDAITIDGKYIDRFSIADIEKSFDKRSGDNVVIVETANFVAIKINKDANVPRNSFDTEDMPAHNVFDRITDHKDIVFIRFELYDENDPVRRSKQYCYYVRWARNANDLNKFQKTAFDKHGNLCLLISENDEITDNIFDF